MNTSGEGKLVGDDATITANVAVSRINLADETKKDLFSDFNPAVGMEKQRWYLLGVIGGVFVLLNAAIIWLIYFAMTIDVNFLQAHAELVDKRLITTAVFQTMIGATVVQTGAVTWAMARFLFPNHTE